MSGPPPGMMDRPYKSIQIIESRVWMINQHDQSIIQLSLFWGLWFNGL